MIRHSALPARTDHLPAMYDLGDEGRVAFCDLLASWMAHADLDYARLLLLVDEAKAVTR